MCLELDGVVFVRDAGEIAGRRVAVATTAGAFKVGFAFVGVAGKEFFEGIVGGNARGFDGFFRTGVQERSDV